MTSRLLVFLIYNKKINKYICFCSIDEKKRLVQKVEGAIIVGYL